MSLHRLHLANRTQSFVGLFCDLKLCQTWTLREPNWCYIQKRECSATNYYMFIYRMRSLIFCALLFFLWTLFSMLAVVYNRFNYSVQLLTFFCWINVYFQSEMMLSCLHITVRSTLHKVPGICVICARRARRTFEKSLKTNHGDTNVTRRHLSSQIRRKTISSILFGTNMLVLQKKRRLWEWLILFDDCIQIAILCS